MTSRSGPGRWERVLAARAQAREALGRDPNTSDPFGGPPGPVFIKSDPSTTEYVLTIGESAVRLGLSRGELEAMIDVGKVETLQGEFVRFIPTREIERLLAPKTKP